MLDVSNGVLVAAAGSNGYYRFNIIDEENTKMYSGQIIKYIVTPIFGINMKWGTEISHVNEYKLFVDEQRFGPYKFWHHKHIFEVIDCGVKVIDILDYAQQNSIEFREDSSNSSEVYEMNMIRNSVLPAFKEFDDNVMLKFKTTINNLQSTKIFVDEIMKETKIQLFQNNSDSIKVNIETVSYTHLTLPTNREV